MTVKKDMEAQAGRGELGYLLMWGLGIPLPLVLLLYFFFAR